MEQMISVATPQAVEESFEVAVPQIQRIMEQMGLSMEGFADLDMEQLEVWGEILDVVGVPGALVTGHDKP